MSFMPDILRFGVVLAFFTSAIHSQEQHVSYKPHHTFTLKLDLDYTLHTLDDRFLSVTLDSGLIRDKWAHFDTSSKKLLTLAKGLSPVYLRVGGTSADFLIFRETPGVTENLDFDHNNSTENGGLDGAKMDPFNMTVFDWAYLNNFVHSVPGWELIFDVNLLQRTNKSWDPNINASELLKLSQEKGFPLAGLELGNEPDHYRHLLGHAIDPVVLSKDFAKLKVLKNSFPLYKKSLIVGPDVTDGCLRKAYKENFFIKFLEHSRDTVDVVTVHQYYLNGHDTNADQFLSPWEMEKFGDQLDTAFRMLHTYSRGKDLWLGETSSAYGGGAPGLSDSYIAGFLWMDKLGMSAHKGAKVVMRQSFYKGSYALLNFWTLDPLPDYWLSLLYKRLVGKKVLQVSYTDLDHKLRVYAHCSKDQSLSINQSVTLYAMNLHSVDVVVTLPQVSSSKHIHFYLLEPYGPDGLLSSSVSLNGKLLRLEPDGELPSLEPRIIHNNTVRLPSKTFGFIVIPDIESLACVEHGYTNSKPHVEQSQALPAWVLWIKGLLLATQYWFRLIYFI